MLDEYKISYIKWDHNRDLIDAGTAPSGRPGVHAQTLAFYRMVAELKAAHPGLEIESCSSGGARVDLGVLAYADRIWVSDCIDPLDRQQMNRWTTQLVPPELMGSHIASGLSHTTGRSHDLSFRAVTAIFGHLGVEWDLAAASEEELADLAEWIAFFKDHRPLLLGGDLVRTDLDDPSIQVQGVSPRSVRGDLRDRVARPVRRHALGSAPAPWSATGPGLPGAAVDDRHATAGTVAAAVVGGHRRAGVLRRRSGSAGGDGPGARPGAGLPDHGGASHEQGGRPP